MSRRRALAAVVATVALSGLGFGLSDEVGPGPAAAGGAGAMAVDPVDRARPAGSPAGLGVGLGVGSGRAGERPPTAAPIPRGPVPGGSPPAPPAASDQPAAGPSASAGPAAPTVSALLAAGAEAVVAVAAQAAVAVPAWAEVPAGDATPPTWQIENPNEFGGVARFGVEEQVGPWLRVQLPIRPNGIEGWIRAGDVTLHPVAHRVEIVLGSRVLRVFQGDEVVFEAPVAVGRPSAPTPVGRFYLRDLFGWDPTSVYGAFVLPLSAYSETIDAINGGEAVIAIHGTNRPEALGRAASLGCIRLDNPTVTALAALIEPGTPVEISP